MAEIPDPINWNSQPAEFNDRALWHQLAQISEQLHHISVQLEEICERGRPQDGRTYV